MANVHLYRAKKILIAAAAGRVAGVLYGDSTMSIGEGRVGSYQNTAFEGLDSPYACWGCGPVSTGDPRGAMPQVAFVTPTSLFVVNDNDASLPTFLTQNIPADLASGGADPINGGYISLKAGDKADWANAIGPQWYQDGGSAPDWWLLHASQSTWHYDFLELSDTSATPDAHFNIRLHENGQSGSRINDFYADGTLYGPLQGGILDNGHVCEGLSDAWKFGKFEVPADNWIGTNQIGPFGRDMGTGMNENEGCNGVIAFRNWTIEFPLVTTGLMFAEHYIGSGLDATECEADFAGTNAAASTSFYNAILNAGGAGTKFLIFLGFGENDASGVAMKAAYEAMMTRIRASMASIGVPVGDYVFVLVSPHDWDGVPDHGFRSVCDDLANEYSDVCHADPSVNVSEADISAVNGFDTGDGSVYNAHLRAAGDDLNALEGVFNPILAAVPEAAGTPSVGASLPGRSIISDSIVGQSLVR